MGASASVNNRASGKSSSGSGSRNDVATSFSNLSKKLGLQMVSTGNNSISGKPSANAYIAGPMAGKYGHYFVCCINLPVPCG